MTKPIDRNITLQLNLLSKFIGEIGDTFGKDLSTNNDFYDFTANNRYTIIRESGWSENLYKEQDKKNRDDQELLLKNIQVTFATITSLQATQSDEAREAITKKLETILKQSVRFKNPNYTADWVTTTMGGYNYVLQQKPSFVEKKLTAKETLEDVIPKMLLLRQYETLVNKIQTKVTKLEALSKTDPKNYHSVYLALLPVKTMVQEAKTKLINSKDLKATLDTLNTDIQEYYQIQRKTFEDHRGNKLVNNLINLFRGFAGVLIAIVTSPMLAFKYEETVNRNKSYFTRATDTASTIGFFQEQSKYAVIAKEAKMDDINQINALIRSPVGQA